MAHFAAAPGRDLLVLAFEGDPSTALERAVSSGRPRVDIWNQWTPVALGIGFALLLSLAYADLKPGGNRADGTIALTLALLPSTIVLPPGLFCVWGFVRLWRRARARRAAADTGRLSGTFEAPRGASWREAAAYGLLWAGMAANAALLFATLSFWIP